VVRAKSLPALKQPKLRADQVLEPRVGRARVAYAGCFRCVHRHVAPEVPTDSRIGQL